MDGMANIENCYKTKILKEVKSMRGYPEHLHEVINEDLQESIYDKALEEMDSECFTMKTRAIYIPDIRFDAMLIFELRGDKFICITDREIQYDLDTIIADNDWIIFSVDRDEEDEEYVYNVRK